MNTFYTRGGNGGGGGGFVLRTTTGGTASTGSTNYRTTYNDYYYSRETSVPKAEINYDDIDVDLLWEKMYTKAKKMWMTCQWCGSVNAIGNPTCCQCGGGLGEQ